MTHYLIIFLIITIVTGFFDGICYNFDKDLKLKSWFTCSDDATVDCYYKICNILNKEINSTSYILFDVLNGNNYTITFNPSVNITISLAYFDGNVQIIQNTSKKCYNITECSKITFDMWNDYQHYLIPIYSGKCNIPNNILNQ